MAWTLSYHPTLRQLPMTSWWVIFVTLPYAHKSLINPLMRYISLPPIWEGLGYLFTGEHDAAIMQNSALINLNVLEAARKRNNKRIFYSSSACIYPEYNQSEPDNPNCAEDSVYPAQPDSEYGWEKLFSERVYLAYGRNYDMQVRIARYHNIFGPEGAWNNGREKSPAAICRKVAQASNNTSIEIWGDGEQTRSFLYVDECLEATTRFTRSDWTGPVNIGSDEQVTINQLTQIVAHIASKTISPNHIQGPLGVRGRNSDNRLIGQKLGWCPTAPLKEGLEKTYRWIASQVHQGVADIDTAILDTTSNKD